MSLLEFRTGFHVHKQNASDPHQYHRSADHQQRRFSPPPPSSLMKDKHGAERFGSAKLKKVLCDREVHITSQSIFTMNDGMLNARYAITTNKVSIIW